METRTLFWGNVGIGVALCLAAFLRILYVRAAWEHTTFHPGYEMDTPALFFALGVVFILVAVVMTLFDWVLARRKSNGERSTT